MVKKFIPSIIGLYLGIHTFIYLELDFFSIINSNSVLNINAYETLINMKGIGLLFGITTILFMITSFLLLIFSIIGIICFSNNKKELKIFNKNPNVFIEIFIYVYSLFGFIYLISTLCVPSYNFMFGLILILLFTIITGITVLILEIIGKLDRALFEDIEDLKIRRKQIQLKKLENYKRLKDEKRLILEAEMEKAMQFDFIDPVQTEIEKKRQILQQQIDMREKQRKLKQLANKKRKSQEGLEIVIKEEDDNLLN